MGRVTIPFRSRFHEELDSLRRDYREVLREPSRREAFDALVRAWSAELGAMSQARIPAALDAMLLTAEVDNRRFIEDLRRDVKQLRAEVEEFREKLRMIQDLP